MFKGLEVVPGTMDHFKKGKKKICPIFVLQ